MSHFLVDGKERGWPISGDFTVAELLDYIRRNFNSERVLVSNVKVNGQEISAQDERTLAPIPVSTLESVEVLTAHPRELAEETLQTLIPFTEHLAKLALTSSSDGASFPKLIDAISTFAGAIDSVREVLRLGEDQPHEPLSKLISELEVAMIATLRKIVKAKEAGNTSEVELLLTQELIGNLAAWHDQGLPALIRARDS